MRCALRVVALSVDAIARPVLPEGLPRDDEPAIGESGHRGAVLITGCCCVDLEFGALRCALRVVALSVDAKVIPVLSVGLPRDDEPAIGESGHRGVGLTIDCACVDLEFGALRCALRVVALSVDAPVRPVLPEGLAM